MKLYPLPAFALLLAGCTAVPPVAPPSGSPSRPGPMMPHTPQPEGLRFFVEPATAAPGATVMLVLHNGTAHQVGYNLCMSALGQLRSDGWNAAVDDRVCTRELRSVMPGGQARYQLRLPTSLAPGEYRFRTGVETPLNRGTPGLDRIYSDAFKVSRP